MRKLVSDLGKDFTWHNWGTWLYRAIIALAIICWNNEALFRLGLTLCFGAFGSIAVWHVISDYIAKMEQDNRKRQAAMISQTQEPVWEIVWQPVDAHINTPNLNSQPVTPLQPSYYYEPNEDEDSLWDTSVYINDDSDDDYWYESEPEPEPYLEDLLDEYFEMGILDDMCEKGNLF